MWHFGNKIGGKLHTSEWGSGQAIRMRWRYQGYMGKSLVFLKFPIIHIKFTVLFTYFQLVIDFFLQQNIWDCQVKKESD